MGALLQCISQDFGRVVLKRSVDKSEHVMRFPLRQVAYYTRGHLIELLNYSDERYSRLAVASNLHIRIAMTTTFDCGSHRFVGCEVHTNCADYGSSSIVELPLSNANK